MRTLLATALVLGLTAPAVQAKPQTRLPLPDYYLGETCVEVSGNSLMASSGQDCDQRARLNIVPAGFSLTSNELFCAFKSLRLTGRKWAISTKPKRQDVIPEVEATVQCLGDLGKMRTKVLLRATKGRGIVLEPSRGYASPLDLVEGD